MALEFKLNLDMKYVTNEKKVQFHAFHPAVTCTKFQCFVSQILQLSLSLQKLYIFNIGLSKLIHF